MQLSDLPIEPFIRILPIEDHLLDLPIEIIVPWLNLLPAAESFRIIGDSGIGRVARNDGLLPQVTVPGKVCNKTDAPFNKTMTLVDPLKYHFSTEFTNFAKSWLIGDRILPFLQLVKSPQVWAKTLRPIQTVDLSMPVYEFLEMKNHYVFKRPDLQLKQVSLHLTLVD
ncbi:hypothetical protein KGF57_003245 [Candida theae]|uniref:Uncharacterized protein n=1 Tax=Candida theae TaxID=1198502 RepID=A0AAD5BDY6_9ASCO|nr:uncharacterized protein KGF57_003245 [Candida theae]KAI5957551.1 hypothetical protein KGF57_003245 [Candida theae]